MRYPAADKLEIIRLVEQSPLPVRRTLAQLGIPRATFYRWYDRHNSGGPEALNDRSPRPDRIWNRIPDAVRRQIVKLALDAPALSPRELAVRFIDSESYFVSEASIYRLLKAHDLIASPAFIVIKAADAFKDKTTAADQLWQTDFTRYQPLHRRRQPHAPALCLDQILRYHPRRCHPRETSVRSNPLVGLRFLCLNGVPAISICVRLPSRANRACILFKKMP
jgi:putative transposase